MNKTFVAFVIISLFFGVNASAQESVTKMQSLYIYNFIKNIRWKNVEDKYVVGIFADDSKVADINRVIGIRKFNSKSIEVKKISSATEASNCQIVFVSTDYISNIKKLNNPIILKNTLLVSEQGGIEDGVSIAFMLQDSKLKFKINESVCKASGLQISASLLSLGQ